MSQPVHYDEIKGTETILLRHHAEFLFMVQVDDFLLQTYFSSGRQQSVKRHKFFYPLDFDSMIYHYIFFRNKLIPM